MKNLKLFIVGLFCLMLLVLIVYQFDFTKRKIASFSHKIEIPDYFFNIHNIEIRFVGRFSNAKTTGIISSEKILDFYNDIHGEQVIINSNPIGGIVSWSKIKSDSFSIIYRDSEGNLNGLNVSKVTDGLFYNVEINSHNE
jgi:hypothetical protein